MQTLWGSASGSVTHYSTSLLFAERNVSFCGILLKPTLAVWAHHVVWIWGWGYMRRWWSTYMSWQRVCVCVCVCVCVICSPPLIASVTCLAALKDCTNSSCFSLQFRLFFLVGFGVEGLWVAKKCSSSVPRCLCFVESNTLRFCEIFAHACSWRG